MSINNCYILCIKTSYWLGNQPDFQAGCSAETTPGMTKMSAGEVLACPSEETPNPESPWSPHRGDIHHEVYSIRTVVMYHDVSMYAWKNTLRHSKDTEHDNCGYQWTSLLSEKKTDPQAGWLDQQTKFRLEKLVYPCISVYANQQPPIQISHEIFRFAPGHYLSHHDVQVPVIIRPSLAIQ